ncbi:transmembrane protein 42 [Anopheles bellator]|uniref:transmembrane protein 42 n=1 Tax=Anopheles bellator TaxID=139047 RepID=UPI002649004C|nr:transmembrane protein 42 [Anopheles bellator]
MDKNKPHYAVVAGLCASFSSLFGKLTSNSERVAQNIGLPGWHLLAQVLCVAVMILLNACVWRFFVKALHTGSGSSLVASLASAATNYVASAILGWLIFDEQTTIVWWIGTSLVLAGLLLLITGTDQEDQQRKRSDGKVE